MALKSYRNDCQPDGGTARRYTYVKCASLPGEMWIPITLAVLVELVPAEVRTSTVALYFFITTNIGGNMPLLTNPVKQAFKDAGYTDVEALRGQRSIGAALQTGNVTRGGLNGAIHRHVPFLRELK